MKKKKKSKLKRIIVLIIIAIIIFSIFGMILRKNQMKKLRDEAGRNTENPEYYEGKIFPRGLSRLQYIYQDAGGNISLDRYYEQIYSTANYLIKLNSTIKKEIDLDDYYETNKDTIKSNIGTINKDNFLEIVRLLKKIDVNDLGKCEYAEIIFDDFKDVGKTCNFSTKIIFSNYEQGISMKTILFKINNNTSETNTVYFEVD